MAAFGREAPVGGEGNDQKVGGRRRERCRQVAADRTDDPHQSGAISDIADQAQTVADSLTANVPEALRPPTDQDIPS